MVTTFNSIMSLSVIFGGITSMISELYDDSDDIEEEVAMLSK